MCQIDRRNVCSSYYIQKALQAQFDIIITDVLVLPTDAISLHFKASVYQHKFILDPLPWEQDMRSAWCIWSSEFHWKATSLQHCIWKHSYYNFAGDMRHSYNHSCAFWYKSMKMLKKKNSNLKSDFIVQNLAFKLLVYGLNPKLRITGFFQLRSKSYICSKHDV